MIPDFNDLNVAIPLFFIPIAVQWWSAWYPGAEPGGGGYIAQRMLSAKDEKDAMKATLFFNAAHYALRPWPWILIALASLIMFPALSDIQSSFPGIDPGIIEDDLAFPAMLSLLPKGLLGLVIAALIAALMSTISTHLNWGSSYMVHDFYVRFINPDASQKTQVRIGRISTLVLMILAAILALFLTNAMQAFNILLQIGAGTGLLFLLRWFWWRINAYSEIAAMIASFTIALYFEVFYTGALESYQRMVIGVGLTSFIWIATTFATRPTSKERLTSFYNLIHPHDLGWKKVINNNEGIVLRDPGAQKSSLASEILLMSLGCLAIYAALFSTGYLLYQQFVPFAICLAVCIISSISIFKVWKN